MRRTRVSRQMPPAAWPSCFTTKICSSQQTLRTKRQDNSRPNSAKTRRTAWHYCTSRTWLGSCNPSKTVRHVRGDQVGFASYLFVVQCLDVHFDCRFRPVLGRRCKQRDGSSCRLPEQLCFEPRLSSQVFYPPEPPYWGHRAALRAQGKNLANRSGHVLAIA